MLENKINTESVDAAYKSAEAANNKIAKNQITATSISAQEHILSELSLRASASSNSRSVDAFDLDYLAKRADIAPQELRILKDYFDGGLQLNSTAKRHSLSIASLKALIRRISREQEKYTTELQMEELKKNPISHLTFGSSAF